MDKGKLRLIILVVIGIVVLTIGIGAAKIYGQPTYPRETLDTAAQSFYQRDYDDLTDSQKAHIVGFLPPLTMQVKNAQFREWLVKPLKWIGIGFGIFVILTAALVASRVILDRTKPPSSSS